jgi:hypothetical protein
VRKLLVGLIAALGLVGALALTGTAPAGADGLIEPTYDCEVPDLFSAEDVVIPIDIADRRDPLAPGTQVTYDVRLSLPDVGANPGGGGVGVNRLSVEVPIPDGVTDASIAFGQPAVGTANPPPAAWHDESDGDTLVAEFQAAGAFNRIILQADGTFTYPSLGGTPVVPPSVTFTATLPATANTEVEWTIPHITADLQVLTLTPALTCTADAPSTVMVSTSTCDEGGFTDVATSHPFYCDISWMNAEGLSTGYQPGPTYKPSAAVSRQAMSAFLYRFAGSPTFPDPAQATFGDVSPSNQFFTEIEWMAAEGISTGTAASPKPLYKPSDPVSRGAMAAFLFRLVDPAFESPAVATFGDVTSGHTFFTEIEWMADSGISTGTPASPKPLYKPATAVSRQAMSAFLHRIPVG